MIDTYIIFKIMTSIITVDPKDLQCKNSLLRQKSKPTCEINIDKNMLISKMLEILYKSTHGTGLSAIQIGIPIRIFVLNMSRLPGKEIIAIDPEIIQISGRFVTRNEGCLCLPDYSGPVKRRNKIKFQAYDLHGNKFLYSAMGYEAAVIQHEFDHLNGILFWDHIVSGAGVKKR